MEAMFAVPAISTTPDGMAAFRRAMVSACEAATEAVAHRVSESDRATQILEAAAAQIDAADADALETDMAHTEATEAALDAAMTLRGAENDVHLAVAANNARFDTRREMREAARWSDNPAAGFDAADAVLDALEAAESRALGFHTEARTRFDLAAEALASAAMANHTADAAAEAATRDAERARSYARRVLSGLEAAAALADTAAAAADAAGQSALADETAAEASYARNVAHDLLQAIESISMSID